MVVEFYKRRLAAASDDYREPNDRGDMIAKFEDIATFARDRFYAAFDAASEIRFSLNDEPARYAKTGSSVFESASISSEPCYAELDTSYGMGAWSVILSVDLRGSSNRAVRVKEKATYLTMHTYLPTMAELVRRANGKIVGLRGDGLFAAFGLTKLVATGREVSPTVAGVAAKNAARCGKAMHEAVADILNPLLEQNDIEGGLKIGVAIAVGDIVVTRIGLDDATEITAYGPPVNQACKLCSKNKNTQILMTRGCRAIFPSGKSGRVRLLSLDGAYVVRYPTNMVMLQRPKPKLMKTV